MLDYQSWMPLWWDFLTMRRLVWLGLFVVGWGATGYFVAPFLFHRFNLATAGYVSWMREMFDRMFMTVTARSCTLAIVFSMALYLLIAYWITSKLPESTFANLLRFVVAWMLVFGPVPFADPRREPKGAMQFFLFGLPTGYNLPRFIVRTMWSRRVSRFEDQMLDGLTFMSNGLKSGLSLIQSMDMVKEELPNPISEEFALLLDEQRLGVQLEEALLNLEARIDTEDLQIMVTSINILRQSGGNLAETFDTIAYTIRERKKVQGKIKSLTAQGVSQGVIIVFMPFVLGGVLYLMEEDLISRLWTTTVGLVMLGVMMTLQMIGALMIKKIVTIDV